MQVRANVSRGQRDRLCFQQRAFSARTSKGEFLMNRKHFVYASLAILIAIYIGMHLSSALAEAQWRRCPIVSKWRLTCTRGGWVWGSNLYRHVETCAAGHRYWACHAASRRVHAAHRAPAPTQSRAQQQSPVRQQQQAAVPYPSPCPNLPTRCQNMGQSTISGSQPPTLVQQERLRQHSPA